MGNNFGACKSEFKSELKSFKLENIENGYWIVVAPEERLSAERDEPLPQSSGSSLGFNLGNSLMIMQVSKSYKGTWFTIFSASDGTLIFK